MTDIRNRNSFTTEKLIGYAESFRQLAGSLDGELQMAGEDRQSMLEERRIWENRQLISHNLNEVAGLMMQVAEEELSYEPIEERKRKMLVHALRSEGIWADNICYFYGEKNRRAIGMTLCTGNVGGVPSDEVADMLSVLLRKKIKISVSSPYIVDQSEKNFLFVDEARFLALPGFCRAVKETESISGDNYSIVESEKGKLTILLSDGTGSGKRASEDSERVLDLMEKMLEAGFSTQSAVCMVNATLFTKREEISHPTLDICSLDLHQGSCEISKIGGVATFLKREQEVRTIHHDSLPLGIFRSVDLQPEYCKLQDGDYLIFMTDGVLDALEEVNCEKAMAESIQSITERNPQEIAHQLLQTVIKSSGGHIMDDMTVLVIGIWEN